MSFPRVAWISQPNPEPRTNGYNAYMNHEDVGHIPVLLDEVLHLLSPQPGDRVFDGTLGRGGHAVAIIPRIVGGVYLGMDLDATNLAFARDRLQPLADAHDVRLVTQQGNFASASATIDDAKLGHADVLLADLGFASNQMDESGRGFSFMGDGPLDMRLGHDEKEWPEGGYPRGTAAELVNTLAERDLADVIYHFGEERLSRRIARKIVERRSQFAILRTGELAEICRRAYGPKAHNSRIHPATRTFQALRIAVNGELDALDALLLGLPTLLAPGGRAGIISFHSLEDRPVKQAFLKMQQDGLAERLPRKPINASDEEIVRNPRSRSAKLRGVRKIKDL